MPDTLTDSDVGLSGTLTDSDVGLGGSLTDADVGIEADKPEAAPGTFPSAAIIKTPRQPSDTLSTTTGGTTGVGRLPTMDEVKEAGQTMVQAPMNALGATVSGMARTARDLVSPTTWLPAGQKPQAPFVLPFGEGDIRTRTPAEMAAAEPIQAGKPLYQPEPGSPTEQSNELARLLSRWSTPEAIAVLPASKNPAAGALLLTTMIPGIVGQVKDAIKGGGSDQEKRDRVNDLVALAALSVAHRAGPAIKEGVTAPAEAAVKPESAAPTDKLAPTTPTTPPAAAPAVETAKDPEVAKKPEVPLRPDPPVPENQFPALPRPGDKLVTIERRDGTRYRAAVSEASWPKEFLPPGITDGRTVHRVAITDKKGTPGWSSGMLDPGEKVLDESKQAAPPEAPVAPAPEPAAPGVKPSFKAGDQVDHQGTTKTIRRMSPDGKFAVIGNRAIPVSELKPVEGAKGKKKYSGTNYRADKDEFERLIRENAEPMGWHHDPSLLEPGAQGYAQMFHKMELKKAIAKAFSDLGIKGVDRFTEKAKAQALPALKAYLEERARPDDPGNHPEGVSTDFLPEEKPGLQLEKPESVEEQKTRLASEEASRKNKTAQQDAADKAARPLTGGTGDLGQGDMLGGGDLFSQKPKAAPGQVQAFGGGTRPPRVPPPPAADPTPEPTPVTPPESEAIKTRKTPGLGILRDIKSGIQSLLLPSSKGPASLRAAELLGSKIGPMNQRAESSASTLNPFRRMFDKLGLDREGVSPTDNQGIKFMSDMSQGRELKGKFKSASDLVQRLFDLRLKALEDTGAALQTVRENYFPGMWTTDSRMAFNAVMEKMGKDFDPNEATPEQKADIRAQVDKMIEAGTGSDKDALAYLTRKPFKGKESFRKQKVFDDIMDAAELGLRPISNNPIDLVMLKLAEMDKSIMANQFFKDPRADVQIINPYEEVGEGRVKINDKYGTIYGPPTVKVNEYVDQKVYDGLLATAKSIGISHDRLMRFPPGPGSRALGLSYTGQNRILSRFGTETSVIAHEIGHQLDEKYGLWRRLTGGGTGAERSIEQKQLRAIAEETERGKTARKKEEKMAQVMEIYIHAPERMKEIAPRIYTQFHTFVQETPELKPFSEIRPGIALKELSGEKYVGLPILGYRTVPEHVGEIINNYLSASLYNNRYFGALYKGWIGAANALNQTQLGMGSMFHAGFTTIEAQISSNANILKDVYGVLRGNRSVADLGKTVVKGVTATLRTPIVGDRVLNAWRQPDGTINPRLAQVVRAAELAGGGFKMEKGLVTEQATKMARDWYSGNRIKAAMRSPVALTELLAKPTMEFIVPRQKAGVFADLAWRIIERNPDKSLEELTPQFRQIWNRDDARLGQVRYDRLFANNTAKNVIQAFVRAPGWSGGTIAEIGGGFTDAGKFVSEWLKTGKAPKDLPDRTAYVLSLVATVGAANAALTYAFTGKQPTGLDFFAFRTGKKDEQGREERFLLPSYMKDILAYAQHPGQTLLNKSHPLISMISDIQKNRDYYGVEIRGRDDNLPTQAGQAVRYVVKGFEPFWTRGARKSKAAGAGTLSARTVAPFFGVMPAPRSVTQTPAESIAHDLMLEQIPSGARTQEQAARSKANAEAHKGEDYLVRTVKRLSVSSALRVWSKASAEEKNKLREEIEEKIDRSKTLSDDGKDKARARLDQ